MTSTASAHGVSSVQSNAGCVALRLMPAEAAAALPAPCCEGVSIGICTANRGACIVEGRSETDKNASKSDTPSAASAIDASAIRKRSAGLYRPANDRMIVRAVEQRYDVLRERQYAVRVRAQFRPSNPAGNDADAEICGGDGKDIDS